MFKSYFTQIWFNFRAEKDNQKKIAESSRSIHPNGSTIAMFSIQKTLLCPPTLGPASGQLRHCTEVLLLSTCQRVLGKDTQPISTCAPCLCVIGVQTPSDSYLCAKTVRVTCGAKALLRGQKDWKRETWVQSIHHSDRSCWTDWNNPSLSLYLMLSADCSLQSLCRFHLYKQRWIWIKVQVHQNFLGRATCTQSWGCRRYLALFACQIRTMGLQNTWA